MSKLADNRKEGGSGKQMFGKQSFQQGLASGKDDGRNRNPKQFSKQNQGQDRDHQGQNYKQSNARKGGQSVPPKKGSFTEYKFGGSGGSSFGTSHYGGAEQKFQN